MKITVSTPKLIYSAPINAYTSKWGVYAIPKMWRHYTGELVVRFNGEQDSGLVEQRLPNLYFISRDNGENWEQIPNGDEIYTTAFFSGINPCFTTLENGDIIGIRHRDDLPAIPDNIPYTSQNKDANGASIIYNYKYADIPQECVDIELFKKSGEKTSLEHIIYDFPERLVGVNAFGFDGATSSYVPVAKKVQSNIFLTPFFSGITELADKTLVAVAHGQHPHVKDRICEEAYLVASSDGGITWKKRGTIASDASRKFGCVGDGGEMSLTRSTNGNLICAIRTDMSIENCPYDTLLSISTDNGYTWSEPKAVADSSVTPHVIALNDGIVLLIYGRPGVHFKVSEDNGMTWSHSYSIIGKTLTEELADGRNIMDCKYGDAISYSNTFVEKIADDTVLVLYNSLKYHDGDDKNHKAGFVRKITVTK